MNKHLSYEDRLEIEKGLSNGLTFKKIAITVNKDCTTISKEIKNHIVFKNSGAVGKKFNNCLYRRTCPLRGNLCKLKTCEEFKEEKCQKLIKSPYVCNGCKNKKHCTLSKQFYNAEIAYMEYKETLKETRQGITYNEQELQNLNNILKPLIKDNKQSIHNAYINNIDKIMCSEKEIYNLIDQGVLEIRNIDLPRKVRFRKTPKRTTYYKIDKKCLDGRRYEDFKQFINENPDINIVEMDTVEGIKGGKVLLTIHFVNCSFMLAFLREHNDAQSVIDIFSNLEDILGIDIFKKLFPVILTDNGPEFSNPTKIEINPNTGELRTKIFYCEPERPDQKGSCEVNHEFIRRILPQGTSFDNLTQKDINLMMSHINSYQRKKLNDCTPLQLFSIIYGNDIASKLGIIKINSNLVNLSGELLKTER